MIYGAYNFVDWSLSVNGLFRSEMNVITMAALFPPSLLITRWRLSTCTMKMHVQFVYARKHYVKIMADMRLGLAT